jgi:plasmid stability protein
MYTHDVMTSPAQITIRNPSAELARRLKAIAEAKGESLNTTILRLLEQAVGTSERAEWLESFATWTEEDRGEFEQAMRDQRRIDEKLWK